MTDLRQAAQQALEAWDSPAGMKDLCVAMDALRKALAMHQVSEFAQAQEQQAEPVSHAVIAGALFDFMGWLTTRKERLVLSSTDNASPAVESITEFAKMRGLSLDDAKVQDWNTSLPQQQAEPVAINQHRIPYCADWYDGVPDYHDGHGPYEVRTLYTTPPQRKPLTNEQADQIISGLQTCHHQSSKREFLKVWLRDWANHGIKEGL